MIICHQHASLTVLKSASLFLQMWAPCWQINVRWTPVDKVNLTSMSSSGWTMTGHTGTGLKSPAWVAPASSVDLKLVITPRSSVVVKSVIFHSIGWYCTSCLLLLVLRIKAIIHTGTERDIFVVKAEQPTVHTAMKHLCGVDQESVPMAGGKNDPFTLRIYSVYHGFVRVLASNAAAN